MTRVCRSIAAVCRSMAAASPLSLLGMAELSLQDEQVFVPVDNDGNPFLPSVARRRRNGDLHYAIGAENNPEYVGDY